MNLPFSYREPREPLDGAAPPSKKVVIVNLQPTLMDKRADLVLHAKVDDVFSKLMPLIEQVGSKDPDAAPASLPPSSGHEGNKGASGGRKRKKTAPGPQTGGSDRSTVSEWGAGRVQKWLQDREGGNLTAEAASSFNGVDGKELLDMTVEQLETGLSHFKALVLHGKIRAAAGEAESGRRQASRHRATEDISEPLSSGGGGTPGSAGPAVDIVKIEDSCGDNLTNECGRGAAVPCPRRVVLETTSRSIPGGGARAALPQPTLPASSVPQAADDVRAPRKPPIGGRKTYSEHVGIR